MREKVDFYHIVDCNYLADETAVIANLVGQYLFRTYG